MPGRVCLQTSAATRSGLPRPQSGSRKGLIEDIGTVRNKKRSARPYEAMPARPRQNPKVVNRMAWRALLTQKLR